MHQNIGHIDALTKFHLNRTLQSAGNGENVSKSVFKLRFARTSYTRFPPGNFLVQHNDDNDDDDIGGAGGAGKDGKMDCYTTQKFDFLNLFIFRAIF